MAKTDWAAQQQLSVSEELGSGFAWSVRKDVSAGFVIKITNHFVCKTQ